ncbi:ATP-binding protein [Candidatus Woesearchaeota archaeon]|nr:ATP-binding protein [Candidatus Woesearchaeota archaeon]
MVKGQVISGRFGEIAVRKKADASLELGELIMAEAPGAGILLQVYDLLYGSQISQQNLELVAGMRLEEDADLSFMDPKLRNYLLALCKNVIAIKDGKAAVCKQLPSFFSEVREVTKQDLSFLTRPKNPLYLGSLRSGSRTIDLDIYLPGEEVLSHHVLVPATTGRGKSNLTSVILWGLVGQDFCGMLVLDPHDEYYGRDRTGLKDHPDAKERVSYYTSADPPPGAKTLKINLASIKPSHLNGTTFLSDAQRETMDMFYRKYRERWIEAILLEKQLDVPANEATTNVLKRKLLSLLDLEFGEGKVYAKGVFDLAAGKSTVADIARELEEARTVIVDTSPFAGSVEILIGSLVTSEIFSRYRRYKKQGTLREKPTVSVVLEEAPRVLGKEVLERGSNVFASVAREGRKFKVGLFAITQLPSLIPREILANMNTKIILGLEMAAERNAIIESAAQDLSTDGRAIAALDRGEAIVTSTFARFATPIAIPLFSRYVKDAVRPTYPTGLAGLKMVADDVERERREGNRDREG